MIPFVVRNDEIPFAGVDSMASSRPSLTFAGTSLRLVGGLVKYGTRSVLEFRCLAACIRFLSITSGKAGLPMGLESVCIEER
jgi:hypothetical protein